MSCVNLSHPSAAYMCQWTGPTLVQIMACRLFGAKPLSEPTQTLILNRTLRKKLQPNLNQNTKLFIHEDAFENICKRVAILSRERWWFKSQMTGNTVWFVIYRIISMAWCKNAVSPSLTHWICCSLALCYQIQSHHGLLSGRPACLGSRDGCWLTHWGPDKMANILQTTFSHWFSLMKINQFPWMKIIVFCFKLQAMAYLQISIMPLVNKCWLTVRHSEMYLNEFLYKIQPYFNCFATCYLQTFGTDYHTNFSAVWDEVTRVVEVCFQRLLWANLEKFSTDNLTSFSWHRSRLLHNDWHSPIGLAFNSLSLGAVQGGCESV